jgi:hypothetical protein
LSWLQRISSPLLLSLLFLDSSGQQPFTSGPLSNLRQRVFHITSDTIRLDTISIVPSSVVVKGVAPDTYSVDYVTAVLAWLKRPASDSIEISYRVFPFELSAAIQRMRYDSVMKKFYVKPFEFNNGLTQEQRGIFDFGTLKAEGSFGRQIGFGNSQDAVLNSTFNMQLSGMLADSIEVSAAITDNNIPIQPDGNTQQLNEFDQVFLQFRKKGWELDLGDIDLRQEQNYFLKFYKRLQGVSFMTKNRLGRDLNSSTLVSGSVAKGKFTRNVIEPLEGNQGPYRLTGANNEIFFIVLANTERVFYDGELLQRGEDQDYVINYNTAEITFTPKRMITKDSRIQVEFEYADRNYLNANLYLSQEMDLGKKVRLRLGAFQNSDAKNSQINQTLDAKQEQFLADLGDSVQRAFYPTAVIDSFAAGKILYQKLYAGLDSFYSYSTDPALAKYALAFVDLGQGNGHYVPDFNGANGKVYRYVADIGGQKQGRYEPVQILVTPKRQQLVTLGIDYRFAPSSLISAEVATSNYDVNTFSRKNNGDDRGWAAKVRALNDRQFMNGRKLHLITGIDYEYVQKQFRPLERLRNVEFSRDWGLPVEAIPIPVDENILKATIELKDRYAHALSYQFTSYHRSDQYDGGQHIIQHTANFRGWLINNRFMITDYHAAFTRGTFVRPVIDVSKELKALDNWRLGFNYSLERNNSRFKSNDSLLATAFAFDIYSAYLRSNDARRNKYQVTFFTRADKYPVQKELIRGDRSLNLNLQAEILANPKRQFYLNTTFRKLKVFDPAVSKQKSDETILGRAEYLMNEWKGLLAGNVLYEVGAGQEQRRDFAYLEVPAGTGQYAWIDYNNDAVQQLNEFEIAAFPDQAKFIRIFTPTNDFVKANYTTFNYSFTVSPRAMLGASGLKGLNSFLSRLDLLSSLQTNKKTIARGSFEFDPFKYGVNDTALITSSTTILNTLSFNRFSSLWGLDISNLRNNGKSLLTYGYESRKLNDYTFKWRWNINRSFLLTIAGRKGLNALYTPRFANRNFQLKVYDVEPTLTYIKGMNFRAVVSYRWIQKKNLPLYGGEKSVSNSVNLESKYNILQNSSITGKFTFNDIHYPYIANTTVSYIMLDGLLPGKNYLWSLVFSKRLLNNLELNFQYDGRKSGTSRTVHMGRAGLTALF